MFIEIKAIDDTRAKVVNVLFEKENDNMIEVDIPKPGDSNGYAVMYYDLINKKVFYEYKDSEKNSMQKQLQAIGQQITNIMLGE